MCKLLDHSSKSPESDADPASDTPPPSPKKQKGGKTGKLLPATYEPDQRADSWLKVKKDYLDGTGDSLDLVPLGAWHGSGRKKGWWSPILLGELMELFRFLKSGTEFLEW